MELFLIRHASAIERAPSGQDEHRALSPAGRKETVEVAGALKKLGVRLSLVVSSPLVRAVETAELIAVGTDYARGIEIRSELAPEGDVRSILEASVVPFVGVPRVALVGHEPSMGHLLSHLLGQPNLSLEKAAVACLDFDATSETGLLRWAISPGRLQPRDSL